MTMTVGHWYMTDVNALVPSNQTMWKTALRLMMV
jgi:hypothetical protein